MPVSNIVGRHDRQAHAPAPARITQVDADMSDADDGAGGSEGEAGQLEPESGDPWIS